MTDTTIGQTLPCANTRLKVNERLTSGHSRRAILGGAGLALVAGTAAAAALVTDDGATAPEQARYPYNLPLVPFAINWLAEWTDAGGSVMPDLNGDDGVYWFGWPEYDLTPQWKKVQEENAGWSDERRDRNYSWGDASHHGKMRALLDLLGAVPEGTETVKALVADNRKLGWSASMQEARA